LIFRVTTAKARGLALQLFTMREGKIVGRREFFWEDLTEDESFDPSLSERSSDAVYSTDYVPREIHVPVDFEDRELLDAPYRAQRAARSAYSIRSAARSAT
jgi:excinuclease ABC subunit C